MILRDHSDLSNTPPPVKISLRPDRSADRAFGVAGDARGRRPSPGGSRLSLSSDRRRGRRAAAELRAHARRHQRIGFSGRQRDVSLQGSGAAAARRSVAGRARAIGAVNTVVVSDGRLVGHNTDATGFERADRQSVARHPVDGPVALIGAGGVGKAIALRAGRPGRRRTAASSIPTAPRRSSSRRSLRGRRRGCEIAPTLKTRRGCRRRRQRNADRHAARPRHAGARRAVASRHLGGRRGLYAALDAASDRGAKPRAPTS